jgi:hypothetical protein
MLVALSLALGLIAGAAAVSQGAAASPCGFIYDPIRGKYCPYQRCSILFWWLHCTHVYTLDPHTGQILDETCECR